MRLSASSVNDDQMDALQEALEEIEQRHQERTYDHDEGGVQETGYCIECHRPSPCPTIKIISRQRSKIQESACRSEETP